MLVVNMAFLKKIKKPFACEGFLVLSGSLKGNDFYRAICFSVIILRMLMSP
jgi:hypothetical protein